jgi:hypothetical protein
VLLVKIVSRFHETSKLQLEAPIMQSPELVQLLYNSLTIGERCRLKFANRYEAEWRSRPCSTTGPPLFETTFIVLLLQTTNAFNGVI